MSLPIILASALPQNPEQTVFWSGLSGCGDSLTLATAISQEKRLLVIVTPDHQTALRLEHELAFFLDNKLPILHFPDWETLPYDVFSPLPEIISERLRTLAVLPETRRGALIVSVATLMHRLAPREHILAHSFSIEVGGTLNLELSRLRLEAVGYQCVSQVYQHAEFAVRGSILDLFPMGSKQPFRIELFDDEVESIRSFDPDTQMSQTKIPRSNCFRPANFRLPMKRSNISVRPSANNFPNRRQKYLVSGRFQTNCSSGYRILFTVIRRTYRIAVRLSAENRAVRVAGRIRR